MGYDPRKYHKRGEMKAGEAHPGYTMRKDYGIQREEGPMVRGGHRIPQDEATV